MIAVFRFLTAEGLMNGAGKKEPYGITSIQLRLKKLLSK